MRSGLTFRDDKIVRFGVQLRPSSLLEIAEQSKLCEKLGFDSIWCADHFIGGPRSTIWPELYSSLTTMCWATSKITIGSAASDCLRRHPATVAQAIASLAHMANRKIVLGLGAGEAVNLTPFGIPLEDLFTRLREAVVVIRKLWSASPSAPANFRGKYYELKNAFLQTGAGCLVTIYIASFQPRMLELTGELGDGWLPFSLTPMVYRSYLEGPIRQSLQESGRSLSSFESCLVPITIVSQNRDEAKRNALVSAKRYLTLLPSVLKMVLPDLNHPGRAYSLSYWLGSVEEKQKEILREIANRIPDEIALDTTICGKPEDCIDQISKFVDVGCNHFIFGVRDETSIHLLAKDVLPYFREESHEMT